MREAKFILPIGAGGALSAGHDYACKALLNTFGGYTVIRVNGAWRGPKGVEVDESNQYVVAMTDGWSQFRAIALEAGRMERQQTIYIVSPTGEAEIVTLDKVVPVLDMDSNVVGHGPDLMPGKPDRIVEKDLDKSAYPRPGEPLWHAYPEVGDLWRTGDQSVVCIVERTMSGKLYGKVLNRGTSGVSYGASVGYTDDGKVDMLEPGPHPLHLKALINRNY